MKSRPQNSLGYLRKEQRKLDRARAVIDREFDEAVLAGKMRRIRALAYVLIQLDRRQDFLDFGYIAHKTERKRPPCTRPPAGWKCTRGQHDGPCAAVPVTE